MDLLELKANIRKSTGNGPARVLRCNGQIPAVLYGPGTESILLSVSINDVEQVLKKSKAGQVLLNLVVKNGETFNKTAMIKELQTHPVSQNFLHIDFYEIAMDRKIRVKVPVAIKGKSIGVELGGVLQIIRRELEIMCLPVKIPEAIEIDVASLDVGDSIHIEDISLEEGMEILADVNFTVITVVAPKTVEEETTAEEEEEEGEETGEEEKEGEAESE